jgi:hypothetical protein
MKHLLKNPITIGASTGLLAVIIHYVNTKIVKKKEKVDMVECAKVFVVMSLLSGGGFFLANKKNLLSKKMLGGGNSSVPNTVINTPINTSPVIHTNPVTQLSSNTISSNPRAGLSSNNGLEISDINDIIHTGTPNF